MARRRRVAPFGPREIVRVRSTERTEHREIAALTGVVSDVSRDVDGEWVCGVMLPRRRRRYYSITADELESTGQFAPPEPPDPNPVTMTVRVDPESDEATAFDSAGGEIVVDEVDEARGPELFSDVTVTLPGLPEDEHQDGVLIAKARRPDGSWRYAVLLDDDPVVVPFDAEHVFVRSWTQPGKFLDFRRPAGIDELERTEPLSYLAAWNAPRPAFGYDQEVRVLDRPHTAPVAGRVGIVRWEILNDDLGWSYWVDFEDDPDAEHQSATVAEEDLEATGTYGEGYNPPPEWLRAAGSGA